MHEKGFDAVSTIGYGRVSAGGTMKFDSLADHRAYSEGTALGDLYAARDALDRGRVRTALFHIDLSSIYAPPSLGRLRVKLFGRALDAVSAMEGRLAR